MKKMNSLLKACITTDMNLFKIKTKKKNKLFSLLIPLIIALYLMIFIYGSINELFEKISPMHLQVIFLSIFVFGISLMTIIEGIYKAGPLMFNCRDDQLLLSLPIKRRTILFVRIFKFYIFEVLFNSLFLLPIMIAYIKWANNLDFTYYLTSIVMLLMLPIIPIVISCILGAITSSLTSRFKYKNLAQIVISMLFVLMILFVSYNMDNIIKYLVKHANSINDLITKIYYPAGIYAKLVTDFNIMDLIIFAIINISIFIIFIFILSDFYFKINSRLKKVTTNKKVSINNIKIKGRTKNKSLIKKELNMFFKTPVFIINAGFALVLYIISTIIISIKYDSINIIAETIFISKNVLWNNYSILILILISVTSYMTSITNSLISLEGRNINILKSLPIKAKTILMSKIYACLIITTPIIYICDIVLFIRLKISIVDSILLLILSLLIPLVSHFIGLIVNLKYPKLDAESNAEVVKQSLSSFISVMIGMILLITSVIIIINVVSKINATLLLSLFVFVYIIIDILLYIYLINKGEKIFNKLLI